MAGDFTRPYHALVARATIDLALANCARDHVITFDTAQNALHTRTGFVSPETVVLEVFWVLLSLVRGTD